MAGKLGAASQEPSSVAIRVRLQRLPGPLQALAVAGVAALDSRDGTFTTAHVASLYKELRLPPPANLSASLARHAAADRLVRQGKGLWAFSPEGEFYLSMETAHVPTSSIAADLGAVIGSELAERRHPLIPPFLAPAGSERGLARLLESSAFELNIMLITRFPSGEDDPFTELVIRMRAACSAHGMNLQLASDGNAEDTLWANVVTYMWGSKYAIVVVDSLGGVLNSNVLIEVGGMLMTGRRCAILKDKSIPTMPTDLVGHIYKSVDLADHDAVEAALHRWMRDDLGLPACTNCP